MRLNRLFFFAGLACLAAPVGFGEARCPGSVTSLPLRPVEGTLFVVQVNVDDNGPYDFLVDTGAQVNSIDEALAARLHLASGRSVGITGAGTYGRTLLVEPDLKVGSETVAHSPTVLVHSAQLQAIGPEVKGILGGSFLEHFDFMIDNTNRVLCLDQSGILASKVKGNRVALADPYPGQHEFLPFTRPIIVSVRLSDFEAPILLALDSGTNSPFLFADHLHIHRPSSHPSQMLKRFVDSHEQDFAVMQPQDARINRVVIRGVSFVVPINSLGQRTVRSQEDGALPTSAFRRIFVSCVKGYVIVN